MLDRSLIYSSTLLIETLTDQTCSRTALDIWRELDKSSRHLHKLFILPYFTAIWPWMIFLYPRRLNIILHCAVVRFYHLNSRLQHLFGGWGAWTFGTKMHISWHFFRILSRLSVSGPGVLITYSMEIQTKSSFVIYLFVLGKPDQTDVAWGPHLIPCPAHSLPSTSA